jgi:prevent-host-death family protein
MARFSFRETGHFLLPSKSALFDVKQLFYLAIFCDFVFLDYSIGEAKNRLTELIRAVEAGEQAIITRHGKPVAQLNPPPVERRKARLGGMKGRIKLLPGWDDPIDEDRFLEGNL